VNWSPAFERFVFSRLPTDKLGSDLEAGFDIETEGSFVLKNNFDDVVIGRNGQLHIGNDLAFAVGNLWTR
jgi:hypothetical protein